MDAILTPVSIGELIDKITILEIKAERIDDAAKLANVRTELDGLLPLLQQQLQAQPALAARVIPATDGTPSACSTMRVLAHAPSTPSTASTSISSNGRHIR